MEKQKLLFGIDRIDEEKEVLKGRCALITTPAGRTLDNRSSIEKLREVCSLVLLLAPEHGVRGDIADGVPFTDGTDRISGLPTASMYSADSRRIPEKAFDGFDTLIYDVQDVGCRYYTFISSLKNALEDCAVYGKRVVVLDRPDPLGTKVSGALTEKECESFVGCTDIPVMYGMTAGEFALMIADEKKLDLDLHVVKCSGLTSGMDFRDWKRPWIMTSPGMPAFETVALYPGTCLMEGTNVSEGRGTSAPFQIIGAPFIDSEEFARNFNNLGLAGVLATPLWFTPNASKHSGKLCGGIHLHVTDFDALTAVELGIRLTGLLKRLYPSDFQVRPADLIVENEWAKTEGISFMSLLAGHRKFEAPEWNEAALLDKARRDSAEFETRRIKYALY